VTIAPAKRRGANAKLIALVGGHPPISENVSILTVVIQ
jgi:hypothetical protein